MKTRNVLIIILAIVLVVVCIFTISDYLKQRDQKESLETQIADATGELALIPQPPADLEERLAAAQDELDAVKESFAIDTNDTRIVKKILETAVAAGVKAIPLSTQAWALESVSDQQYSVFRLELAVTGNYSNLVSFLNQLENGEPKTLIIEYLSVRTIPGASLLDAAARDALTLNAIVRIAIYASTIASE
jgi:Tfp pilus assembly protein PilO